MTSIRCIVIARPPRKLTRCWRHGDDTSDSPEIGPRQKNWYAQDAKRCRRQHAADYANANCSLAGGTRTAGQCQGQHTENESHGRHYDRTKTQTRRLSSRLRKACTLNVKRLGELDDEDGVLGGKADDRDCWS
jgi:hypothetical protein